MGATQKIVDAELDRRLDRADLAVAVERYHFEIGAGAARADLAGKAGKRVERQADILEADMADPGPKRRFGVDSGVGHGAVVACQHEDEVELGHGVTAFWLGRDAFSRRA